MRKDNCIFCKIMAGEIPSHTIYEDENCKVFLSLGAASKGHALVVPKEHYDNFYDIPEETAAEVIKTAKKMTVKMTEKLQCDGFNLLQNNNEVAGQSVMHYHLHLIPRYKNDNVNILPDQAEVSQEELAAVKDIIIG